MDNSEAKEFGELKADIRANQDAIREMKDDIECIRKILLGNGEEGLLTKFKTLEDSVVSHHSEYAELKKSRSGFFRWVIEIFIAAMATIAAILQIKNI